MNKKFSTLLAGLLFACLFSVAVNAQHAGEIPYRTQNTKADAFDATQNDYGVNAINSNYWYQLQVTTPAENETLPAPDAAKVLVQVRNYETGNLTLKVVPQALLEDGTPGDEDSPSLTSSLWKIEVVSRTASTFMYKFTNKETGYTLSYNCDDAINLTALAQIDEDATSTALQTAPATINKSDVSAWRWYTADTNATGPFNGSKPYTFNHDSKKVLGFALNEDNEVVLVDITAGLVTGNGQEMVGNYNILSFTVRNAGAHVLNAADINSMIDADGSWQNRTSVDSAAFKVTGFTGVNDLFTNKYKALDTEIADYLNDAAGNYAGYSIILKKGPDASAKYFMVATDATYEPNEAPTAHGGLQVLDAAYTGADLYTGTMNALKARYHWKVTYFPTPDSLAFEPLNASIVGAQDYQAETKWADTPLAAAAPEAYYNTVNAGVAHAAGVAAAATNVPFNKPALEPVALIQMNATDGIDSKTVLTVGQSKNAGVGVQKTGKYGKPVLTAAPKAMGLKVQFANAYTYLQRAAIANDVYFIQISVAENLKRDYRKESMYLVYNMEGRLMYDLPDDSQDYTQMPATQWVVERDTCDLIGEAGHPWITIRNREYGDEETTLFEGQLYKAEGTDKYYIINHQDYNNVAGTDGKFANALLSCGDTIYFTPVGAAVKANPYLGYKRFIHADLKFETYAMKYLHAPTLGAPNTNYFLNIKAEGDYNYFSVNSDEGLDFEVDTLLVDQPFGYSSVKAGAVPLFRTNYALKVRDYNLIDNQWGYVVVAEDANRNPYYQMAHLKDVDGKNTKLATFYFKADQVSAATETEAAKTAYALVDATGWELEAADKKEGWVYGTTRLEELDDANPDELAPYAGRLFQENGFKRVDVKDQSAKLSYMTLNTAPMDRVSAFIFTEDARKLYQTIPANANYTISRARGGEGQAVEYLYEDAHNSAGLKDGEYVAGFNYAGITAEGVGPVGQDKTTAFYVDEVIASSPRMPKYLFFVDNDSINDGRWCVTDEHGYFSNEEEANEADATHHVYYNGYVAGRILVNLNDSVKNMIGHGMLNEARKYAYRNYTRLGFVEAIHMNVTAAEAAEKDMQFTPAAGEYLYILTGTTLAELTAEEYGVIHPKRLADAITAGKVKVEKLNNLQQNFAWSLRMADDEDDLTEVMLESGGFGEVEPAIGTFTEAGWVQVLNSVPVMAQKYNINGDHTEIDGSSTLSQLVNQAQLFSLKATDDAATSNEGITAATIKVYGGNGTITVQGAEGNVAVTNTLGQTIVNKLATGSEFTVEVPAGIMIVKVAGQPAVKVLVK